MRTQRKLTRCLRASALPIFGAVFACVRRSFCILKSAGLKQSNRTPGILFGRALAPGRTAKRRAADADARTSRVYRPARDGVLLPRLSVQMARDQTGTAIDAGAAGVYRASFDDLDSAPDGGRASAALKKEGAFSVFGEGGRFFVPPRFSGKGLEKRVWPKQQK